MMVRYYIRFLMFLAFMLVGVLLPAASAHAQASDDVGYQINTAPGQAPEIPPNGTLTTVDENGNKVTCDSIEEVKEGKLVGKIVPCMVRTIEGATKRFTQVMVTKLRPLLYVFLTLVVIFFGIRMLGQEQQIYTHGIILIIKVAFIVGILDLIPGTLVPATYTIMKDSQAVVLGAIDATSMKCANDNGTLQWGGPNTMPVWAISDCILGKIFGYTVTGSGAPGLLINASMLGVVSGVLFGGPWGVVVFFGLLGVMISIFMLVVRTIYAFLSGYLVVCICLIISPLILPLMFLKATQTYAEPIWKNILSAFIMPIVVTAYTMVGLMIYDKMLFADDSLLKTLFNEAKVTPAQLENQQPCSVVDMANPSKRDPVTVALNKFMHSFTNPNVGVNNDLCSLAKIDTFKPELVDDPKFKKGTQTYAKMFEQLMTLLLLGYLVNTGLTQLSGLVAQLSLSSGTVRAALGQVKALSDRVDGALTEGRKAATNAFSPKEGDTSSSASDAGKLGASLQRGAQSFYDSLSKEKPPSAPASSSPTPAATPSTPPSDKNTP